MITYNAIFNQAKRAFSKQAGTAPTPPAAPNTYQATPAGPDDVALSPDALVHITEKLLAVNRGHAEPDERDSLEHRRVFTPDKLFAERVTMDANRLRRVMMRRVSKARNLKSVGVAHFDPYIEGLMIGSPLSSPSEEINPVSLIEQNRRITQMGPGGIPSDDSVTSEAQAVHPSIFGFLSAVEGPESSRAGVDTRLAWGAKLGSDGKIYQTMRHKKSGQLVLVSPNQAANAVVGIPE